MQCPGLCPLGCATLDAHISAAFMAVCSAVCDREVSICAEKILQKHFTCFTLHCLHMETNTVLLRDKRLVMHWTTTPTHLAHQLLRPWPEEHALTYLAGGAGKVQQLLSVVAFHLKIKPQFSGKTCKMFLKYFFLHLLTVLFHKD